MDFKPNINPVEIIKKVQLVEPILEIFTQVSMINFMKIVGKNLKN